MKLTLIVLLCLPMWAQRSDSSREKAGEHPFPTSERIQLLITQSERAFDTYELAIERENLVGGKLAQSVPKDREVLVQARELLAGFKKKPDLFNGPAGFLLVGTLDDASRNMSVCMGQAGMEPGFQGMNHNLSESESYLHLVQTCLDASNLLYTVSETAFDMYSDFLLAQEETNKQAMSTLEGCVNMLKENRKDSK